MIGTLRATEHKDLRALAKFLIRVYKFEPSDFHADPRLLEWKYLYPRASWQGGRSYLLEKDGQIIAHCGICPVTFHLPDETIINSLTMMDWAADPGARGAGKMLFCKLMEMAPTSFIIGGTPPTRHILPRIGFRPMGDAVTYTAWFRPWREYQTRPWTRRSTLRLLHGLTHPVRTRGRESAGWNFASVDQFDGSLLPVLNSTKRSWTFCQRTLSDLNHLLKCPHVKMQGFLLRREGQLIGYFIIGKAEWEARLLDLAVDSAGTKDWNLACAMVTKAAQLDPEVCRIRSQASFPLLAQALVWNGYWRQEKQPIALHDPANALGRALPVDFQFFDGDYGY
ncbi:MAG: GNAT family N-acetyltransferase [Terriglobales bacterium]